MKGSLARKVNAVKGLCSEATDTAMLHKNACKGTVDGLSMFRLWMLMAEEFVEVTWAMMTGKRIKEECGDLCLTTAFIHQRVQEERK